MKTVLYGLRETKVQDVKKWLVSFSHLCTLTDDFSPQLRYFADEKVFLLFQNNKPLNRILHARLEIANSEKLMGLRDHQLQSARLMPLGRFVARAFVIYPI